jgi:antitoxin CcdA
MSEIITVRVDKKTKEMIKKHRINVSSTVRKALENEIKKKEEEQLRIAFREGEKILRKISKEDLVRLVRESRDSR